jgi:hypothetical protein
LEVATNPIKSDPLLVGWLQKNPNHEGEATHSTQALRSCARDSSRQVPVRIGFISISEIFSKVSVFSLVLEINKCFFIIAVI